MKKSIVVGIILLFLLSSLIPITSSYSSYEINKVYSIHIDENGTLSGYVKDTSMNPIEGAKVQVYFHETYEESYTDSSGYYHVTNIPICYCLKNATVSKKGYRSGCVLLSINETTIHNFVLTLLGNTLYVGGSGPGNYSKIQDAIGNASDGDTIFVYDGNYYENLIVDKSINLIGAERNATIIYGKNNSKDYSSIVKIKDDNVTVSEFTLSTERNLRGIFIEGSDSHLLANIRIFNNTIIRPEYGDSICIFYARNIYISSNILYGVFGAGYCINVTVYSNEIHGYGIECVMALSIHFIKNNLFLDFPSYPMVKYLIFQPWEVIKYPWYNVKFKNNYFGRACIFPKPIIFLVVYPIPNTHPEIPIIFPWLIFDWHPAKEPYGIL